MGKANVDPAELIIENATVQVPGSATKRVTFAELGRIAYNNQHLIPEDMEAGLRFHRRLIEGSRSDSPGRPSTQ